MRFTCPARRASLRALLVVLALALCCPLPARAGALERTQALHPDMPSYLFSLAYRYEGDLYYTSAITVAQADTRQLVQQITLSPEAQSWDDETLSFTLEDMNFDGYLDMRIMAFLSASSSDIPYLVWLWNPAAHQFEHSAALSAIPSPEANAVEQVIRGYAREDVTTSVQTTHAWVEGDLVLIGRTTISYDMSNNVVHTAVEELREGSMTLISRYDEPLVVPEADE